MDLTSRILKELWTFLPPDVGKARTLIESMVQGSSFSAQQTLVVQAFFMLMQSGLRPERAADDAANYSLEQPRERAPVQLADPGTRHTTETEQFRSCRRRSPDVFQREYVPPKIVSERAEAMETPIRARANRVVGPHTGPTGWTSQEVPGQLPRPLPWVQALEGPKRLPGPSV